MLFIQRTRRLDATTLVVRGPSSGDVSYRHDGVEVAIYDQQGQLTGTAQTNWKLSPLLSSSERFGFDPIVDERPLLKSLQNYDSTILAGVAGEAEALDGCVLVESLQPSSIFRRLAKFNLYTDRINSNAIREWSTAAFNEPVVTAFEYSKECSGFLLLPAAALNCKDALQVTIIARGNAKLPSEWMELSISGPKPRRRETAARVVVGEVRLEEFSDLIPGE